MTFIWPPVLLSLVAVPAFAAIYVGLRRRRRQQRAALGPMGAGPSPGGSVGRHRIHVPFGLFLAAMALMLVALARPEVNLALPRYEGTIVLVFDTSNSMAADDVEPSRLEAAKQAARAFVERRPDGIEIGVVSFSNGGVVTQAPTGVDADVVAAIDRLEPTGGTSIAEGLFTALGAIAGEPLGAAAGSGEGGSAADGGDPADLASADIGFFGSSVVVLFSDGEDLAAVDPREVAQLASNAGVRVFPVGVGRTEGAVLAVDGFRLATRLDEPLLEEMADITEGSYQRAGDGDLAAVYDRVETELRIDGEPTEMTGLVSGAALLLLLGGSAASMLWFGRLV